MTTAAGAVLRIPQGGAAWGLGSVGLQHAAPVNNQRGAVQQSRAQPTWGAAAAPLRLPVTVCVRVPARLTTDGTSYQQRYCHVLLRRRRLLRPFFSQTRLYCAPPQTNNMLLCVLLFTLFIRVYCQPAGSVSTYAGNTSAGNADGMGRAVTFSAPKGLAIPGDLTSDSAFALVVRAIGQLINGCPPLRLSIVPLRFRPITSSAQSDGLTLPREL